jgi:hypothetical protein
MANRYWRGGSGNWNDTSHWSTTSGGTGGASVPGASDAAIVNSSSGSPTITINAAATLGSLTMGAAVFDTTKTMYLKWDSNNYQISVAGNIFFGGEVGFMNTTSGLGGCIMTATSVYTQFCRSYLPYLGFNGSGATFTISNGQSAGGGSWDATFTTVNYFDVLQGTVTMPYNDFGPHELEVSAVYVDTFTVSNSTNTRTVDFSSGTNMFISKLLDISVITGLTVLNSGAGSKFTFDTTSNAAITSPATTFNGGGLTWPYIYNNFGHLTITGNNTLFEFEANSGTANIITGSNTISTWALDAGTSWIFTSGTTQTITAFANTPNGLNYSNISLVSSIVGSQASINIGSATLMVSWWSARDINIEGSPVIAYRSLDLGDNSNITFIKNFQRYFTYDVYTPQALHTQVPTFVGQYADVITDPQFPQQVNNPGGQLTIRRGVDPTNFGEGTLVDYNNHIVVKAFTEDYPNGQIIMLGYLSSYTPNIEPDNEYLDIIVLSYGAEFSQYLAIADPTADVTIPLKYNGDYGPYARIAQSWTTGSGITNLSSMSVPFSWTGPGVDLYIYKDNGSNTPDNTTALYHIEFAYPGNIGDDGDTYINFSPNITVTASSKYWVVVVAKAGASAYMPYSNTNTYSGGNLATYSGSTWTQHTTLDITDLTTYSSVGNTTVTYTAEDIQTVLQDLISNYNIQGGNIIIPLDDNGIPTTIDDPGTTMTYTFQTNTVLEAIQVCNDFAPAGWYWYVDMATNYLHFHAMQTTPKHYFTIGKDITSIQLQKTMETVVNDVLVVGGPTSSGAKNLFYNYFNTASISRYGKRVQVYSDSNIITSAAALQVATKIITQSKLPTSRAPVTVLAQPNDGYNIESIKPGDVFFIQGMSGAVNLQISEVDYNGYSVNLSASTVPPKINNALNDAQDAVQQVQTSNNPTSPTQVSIT